MRDSRLFYTVRNTAWRVFLLLTTAIANLIIPRYIILIYGSEVNGLTSSITQVLSLVNIIQAGLASSVTYLMYKPLGEKDRITLGNIIMSAKRIYKYISLSVSGIGIVASFIFAFAVKTNLQREYILIASLITCLVSATDTFFTAVGNIFLSAKQDGYLLSRITTVANVVGYALKALIILFKPHFMWLYVVNIVVCAINIVSITTCFRRRYKPYELSENEKKELKYIQIPGISYAAANEVAHTFVNASLTIVISTICGLKASSIFSVYMIAISVPSTISNAIYSAVVPGYGSVAAEGDIHKTNKIFEIYQFILFSMNAIMLMCASYMLIPFVKLYTNGVIDAEYTNTLLMVLIIVYGAFAIMRIPYNNTVYITGHFKETFLQPVICAIISVAMMAILAKVNYTFVVIGSIFFFAANTFYQHFKLPKIIEGFENGHFWRHFSVFVIGLAVSILAYFGHPIECSNYFQWACAACCVVVASAVIVFVLSLVLDRKSLKVTTDYFIARIKTKKGDK